MKPGWGGGSSFLAVGGEFEDFDLRSWRDVFGVFAGQGVAVGQGQVDFTPKEQAADYASQPPA